MACQEAIKATLARAPAEGSPLNLSARIETLGRARGEPLVWLREPRQITSAELPEAATRAAPQGVAPRARIARLVRALRGSRAALRGSLLREGYVYSSEPLEALALAQELRWEQLYDEPALEVLRGSARLQLASRGAGAQRHYVHVGGSHEGQRAELLHGDQSWLPGAPQPPRLHLDFKGFAREAGTRSLTLLHLTPEAVVAELSFEAYPGSTRALLRVTGSGEVALECLDAPAATRAAIGAQQRAEGWRRAARASLRGAIDEMVVEQRSFDRPRGVEGPDRDGELRPAWYSAYLRGQHAFRVEEASYLVFDRAGAPAPPGVCADFVLESFERAAGTWFTPRGEPPARRSGRLDFNQLGIKNRRGVIALGRFFEEQPELFEFERFTETIPFAQRSRFFAQLSALEGGSRPGDIVAIRGLKRDGRVHQHALLVEETDPLTGFPYGLADHMSRPRRRTWEGIMAEAPARALYYRARLRDPLLQRLPAPSQRVPVPSQRLPAPREP